MTRFYRYWPEILSGLAMGMAHQPMHLGFLAWVGLIPFIHRQVECRSLGASLISAFIWGFTYHLTSIFWLAQNIGTNRPVAAISMAASVLFMTLNTLLIAWLWYRVRNHLWMLPLVWVTVEYARTFGSLGFPWVSLANTQTDYLLLAQNVEITGIYGISFWIVTVNILVYMVWRSKDSRQAIVLAVVFIFPWLYGYLLTPDLDRIRQESLTVAVVQPNIHLSEKWDDDSKEKIMSRLLEPSRDILSDSIDLIIWPETSVPGYPLHGSGRKNLRAIQGLLAGSTAQLLTGVRAYDRIDHERFFYNSVAQISADGIEQTYHKIQLVPMAEYIPLSGLFPSLKKLNLGQANFTSGDEYTLFSIQDIACGAVVCFETTFPQLMRSFVRKGARFMVAVVNDGWYETPPEPQQHAAQLIYRAIETRKPMIRCANTGISMIVDAAGNIISKSMLNERIVLTADIYPNSITTFYSRFGDLFAQLVLLLTCVTFIINFARKT